MRSRRTLLVVGMAVAIGLALVAIAPTVLTQKDSATEGCLVPPCLFDIRGTITIGSDQGNGMINITVSNHARYAFTNITLVDAGPGLTNLATFTPFTNHDRVINPSNALQVGENSSGWYNFEYGGSAATTYRVTVSATLTNGQVITEQTDIVSDS
ncbi:MAG: hypothetical protein ABSG45_05640 [Nitrososphaerales archaeon]